MLVINMVVAVDEMKKCVTVAGLKVQYVEKGLVERGLFSFQVVDNNRKDSLLK